jgi:glycosyltransferase involved in cell wall biosynthesis
MTRTPSPLRIAIIGTNNDSMYSGGRYHALIMAYALARAGLDVTVITNKKPRFFDDLEPLAPNRVGYVYTPDFHKGVPKAAFDYVVMIPTGIFLPAFYEAVFDFTRKAGARPALINFESGNWFNAVSPVPRDLRLWEYWRRLVADGGLVISSLRVSDTHARDFYAATIPQTLRFEVCGPPINSPAADPSVGIEKDGSVVVFVRSSDPHKGGADLLGIDAEILRERTLKVIAGGPVDPDFSLALQAHFLAAGARIEFHTAISDAEKFSLIAQAQAVLFPSRFEGFGYPPVEAAYMGTETVCYDLPALQETVGDVAQMAPVGDVDALGAALARALEMPPRTEALNAAAANLAGIDAVALRLSDIFLRSLDVVPPLRAGSGRAAWGPFNASDADVTVQSLPALPALVRSFRHTASRQQLLSLQICSPEVVATAVIQTPGVDLEDVHIRQRDMRNGSRILEITGRISGQHAPTDILTLALLGPAGDTLATTQIQLIAPERASPVQLSLTGLWLETGGSRLTFSVKGADRIALRSDGGDWHEAAVVNGTATLQLGDTQPHKNGMTVYLFAKGEVLEIFTGCPTTAGMRARTTAETVKTGGLEIADLSDDHWHRGVLRRPDAEQAGVIVCQVPKDIPAPAAGDTVRLGSGRLLAIRSVHRKGKRINLNFAVAIDPEIDGYPGSVTLVARAAGNPHPVAPGPGWANGVWVGAGNMSGRCLLLASEAIDAFDGITEDLAVLSATGGEIAIEKIWRMGPVCAVWVVTPVDPRLSARAPFEVIRSSGAANLKLLPGKGRGKPPSGPVWSDGLKAGHVIRLAPDAQAGPGDILAFPGGALRYLQAVETTPAQTWCLLDLAAPEDPAGPLRFASLREQATLGQGQLLYPTRISSPGASKILWMSDQYRQTLPPQPAEPATDRPRVLFASIVPPDPADQGNRIVTRNFIAHLLARGFDVDLLLIGRVSPERMVLEFGDRVRVFSWAFPKWETEPSAALRQHIVKTIRDVNPAPAEAATFQDLLREASTYHPFYIVPDPLIRMAQALYHTHEYHSIVCNYTHLIRVACELAPIRPLPPVTVVTHDALSRLPLEYGGQPLNTMYRMCAPETERAVLDAVPGAVILAISTSEQRYFREIGVQNPIELCEYDGLQECSRYRVLPGAFEGRRLLFHASGNPMNRVAIDWFLQSCWDQIRSAVPDATLVVCGGICNLIDKSTPGIELHGIVARSRLMEILGTSSVAINPTLAGTGLKIKTVEAACAGLPSVCLPGAIEGLEAVAERFCLLGHDPESFSHACIRLLSDKEHWDGLRESALALAAERFSEAAIYGPVDKKMGWDRGVEDRFAARRTEYGAAPAPALADLVEALPQATRDNGRIAAALSKLGESATASRLLARIVDLPGPHPKDLPAEAARLALADANTQGAIHLALATQAQNPGDALALQYLVRAAVAVGDRPMANGIWQQMALALPARQALADLAEELGLNASLDAAAFWARAPVEVPLNARQYLKAVLQPGQRVGTGWSPMEPWGAWTNGRYARLDLTFAPTTAALRVQLRGHANVLGASAGQKLRISAEGRGVGGFEINREPVPSYLELAIPAAADDAGRSTLALEFFIDNPTPIRPEDSPSQDSRLLGLALQAIMVSEVAAP